MSKKSLIEPVESEENAPKWLEVERPGSHFPGSLHFPPVESFNRLMHMAIRHQIDARPMPKGGKLTQYDFDRIYAFRAAAFIREGYGKWEIEGLTVEEFLDWEHRPDLEKLNFVFWVKDAFLAYQEKVEDPNFKPGS